MFDDPADIRHDSAEDERIAGNKLEREIRADRMRRGLLTHSQPEDSFPHGISCACCWEQLICNHCGKDNVRQSTGRCTNGRCTQCCFKFCQHRTS